MKCPKPDELRLLSMGLIEPARADRLREHFEACGRCREAYEGFEREHQALAGAHEAFGRGHDLQREQLLARLSGEEVGELAPPGAGANRAGGILMKMNNPYGRGAAGILAAAACVALVVTMFSAGESTALARVIERLREAQTITCQVKMTMNAVLMIPTDDGRIAPEKTSNVQTEELSISKEFGIRRDTYQDDTWVSSTFVTPAGATTYVHYPRKQFHVYDPAVQAEPEVAGRMKDLVADRVVPGLHMGLSSDPTYLIEALRDLTAEADVDLGWQTLNGVKAYGFELSGAKAGFGPPLFDDTADNKVRIWFDPETALPVRIELHFVSKIEKIERSELSARFVVDAVYDQFDLDVALERELFAPEIPEDFAPIDELSAFAGKLNEAAFVESLRVFGEQTGRYPTSLNLFNIAHEVSFLIGSIQGERLAAQHHGADTSEFPDTNEVGKKLQGFAYFTKLESDGAMPEYFGDTVKPGDGESVLVQWTLPDGATRVIYGDLSVETLP
jgi:outer membrane lipoprotein-sorting protein